MTLVDTSSSATLVGHLLCTRRIGVYLFVNKEVDASPYSNSTCIG